MRLLVKSFLAVILSIALSGALSWPAIPDKTVFGQEKTVAPRTDAPLRTKEKKEQIVARLEQRIPQLMKDGDVPGLSIGLLRDGELVWRHGFGVKNTKTNEPVTDDTVFEAASLS
jgi:CubicO group peptidase (beta-lactamase class C family)